MKQKVIIDTNALGSIINNEDYRLKFFSKFDLVIPLRIMIESYSNPNFQNIISNLYNFHNQVFILKNYDLNLRLNLKNHRIHSNKIFIIDFKKYIMDDPVKFCDIKKNFMFKNNLKLLNDHKKKHELVFKKMTKTIKNELRNTNQIFNIKKHIYIVYKEFSIFRNVPNPSTVSTKKIRINKKHHILWHFICFAHFIALEANMLNQTQLKTSPLKCFRNKKNFLIDLEIISTIPFCNIFVSNDNDCIDCAIQTQKKLKENNIKTKQQIFLKDYFINTYLI